MNPFQADDQVEDRPPIPTALLGVLLCAVVVLGGLMTRSPARPAPAEPSMAAATEPTAPEWWGHGEDSPADRRGEAWTDGPTYQGTTAAAYIEPHHRVRNVGSNVDGAGLCVPASITANGNAQGIGPSVRKLWEAAKDRPGGYAPQKLIRLVEEVAPELRYANYVGKDFDVVKAFTQAGYPVGGTMDTGKLYGYQKIAHMVSIDHADDHLTGWVDNNKPEVHAWAPTPEFERRWAGWGGEGWAWVWEAPPVKSVRDAALFLPVVIGLVMGLVVLHLLTAGDSDGE